MGGLSGPCTYLPEMVQTRFARQANHADPAQEIASLFGATEEMKSLEMKANKRAWIGGVKEEGAPSSLPSE